MNRRRALVGAAGIVSLCAGAASAALGACGDSSGPSEGVYSPGEDSGAPSGSGSGSVTSSGSGSGAGSSSGSGSGGGSGSSSGSSSGGSSGSSSGSSSSGSGSGSSSGATEAGSGLGGNGCAGGTCQNPDCNALGTPADIGTYASLGFETLPTNTHPDYIPNDTIIPTFDDVPDGTDSPPDPTYGAGGWTTADLAFFDANGMHVDFFINTNNWCGDVTKNAGCTAAIMDILTLHNPADHTVYHPYMGQTNTGAAGAVPNGCTTVADCTSELTGVESVIDTMSGGARPHLTRFRLPYGVPDQNQGTNQTLVDGVVAQFAVQIGWNIDSGDSAGGTFTGAQIAQNVETSIGTGPGNAGWGIILQHGTYPWTHDAIPLLYGPNGYLAQHGFKTATVEDAICWKYGKHSWEIVQQLSGQARSPN